MLSEYDDIIEGLIGRQNVVGQNIEGQNNGGQNVGGQNVGGKIDKPLQLRVLPARRAARQNGL